MTATLAAPGLTDAQLAQFRKDGYLVLPPGTLPEAVLAAAAARTRAVLPDWKDGFSPAPTPQAEKAIGFHHGLLHFHGTAHSRRSWMAWAGVRHAHDPKNWLWGRRATFGTPFWDAPLAALSEDPALLAPVRAALGARELSLLDASVSNVYPGCTGEEGKVHADQAGFTSTPLRSLREGRWVLNVLVYFSDVDEALAPMRVFPGTHLRYAELNDHLAKAFGKRPGEDAVPQAGELYEELLPSWVGKPVFVTGKRGTVVLMHSGLLHSATENKTADRARAVSILNYSDRRHAEFRKDYSHLPRERAACRGFTALYKDRGLVARSFEEASLDPVRVAKHSLRGAWSGLKRAAETVWRRGPRRAWISLLFRVGYPLARRWNAPITRVNVGAGQDWRHPFFHGLDMNPTADVFHNLTTGEPLPFADGSMDALFSSHCFEHLPDVHALRFIRDAQRVLKPGGVLRITCPDMDVMFDAYDRRDLAWFDWVRNKGIYAQDGWLRLVVRHFADPSVDLFTDEELHRLYRELPREAFMDRIVAEAEKVDQAALKQSPLGHKSWWTKKKLLDAMRAAGFSRYEESRPYESRLPELRDRRWFDFNTPHMSLYVEAVK